MSKLVLHQRLGEARERLGLTQAQVGKLAKLNPMHLSHFECGRRLPSCKNLIALAVALRVSVDWLLGLENTRKIVNWPRAQRIPLLPEKH